MSTLQKTIDTTNPKLTLVTDPPDPPDPPDPVPKLKTASFPEFCSGFLKSGAWRLEAIWGRYDARHGARITKLVIDASGRKALSTGLDGAARIWNLETGKQLLELRDSEEPSRVIKRAADFSPDGRQVAIGTDDGRITIFDSASGELIKRLSRAAGSISVLRFDRQSQRLLIGEKSGKVMARNLITERDLGSFQTRSSGLTDLIIHPNNMAFAAAAGRTVQGWDLAKGKLMFRLETSKDEGAITALELGPDGIFLAASTMEGKVVIFNLIKQTQQSLQANDETIRKGAVHDLAFSPDGRLLFTGGADALLHSYGERGQSLHASPRHNSWIQSVAVDRNSGRVLTGGDDGRLILWDPNGLKSIWPQDLKDPIQADLMTVSLDEKYLAVGSRQGQVILRDAQSGEVLARRRLTASVVRFIQDRNQLAVGGQDGSVTLLSLPSFGALSRSTPFQSPVVSIDFLKSAQALMTSDVYRQIKTLPPKPADSRISKIIKEPAIVRAARLDGQELWVRGHRNGDLQVLNVDGFAERLRYPGSKEGRRDIVTHPEADVLVDFNTSNRISRRSLRSQKSELLSAPNLKPICLTLSANGDVAAGYQDRRLLIWPKGELQPQSIDLSSSGDFPLSVAFSKDRLFIGTSRGPILVFGRDS